MYTSWCSYSILRLVSIENFLNRASDRQVTELSLSEQPTVVFLDYWPCLTRLLLRRVYFYYIDLQKARAIFQSETTS